MNTDLRALRRQALLLAVWLLASSLPAQQAATQKSEIVFEKNVMVPMRDGVRLATDLYRPAADGKYPAILMRTPYNKDAQKHDEMVRKGYVLVSQDCRGRFASEGDFKVFVNEGPDGCDTIKWTAEQPWCNGKVLMTGGSYVASTQIIPAIYTPPNLEALQLIVCPAMDPKFTFYQGGAFRHEMLQGWMIGMALSSQRMQRKEVKVGEISALVKDVKMSELLGPGGLEKKLMKIGDRWRKHLPLTEYGPIGIGGKGYTDTWDMVMQGWYKPEIWNPANAYAAVDKIDVPCLFLAGVYDIFCQEDIEIWKALRERGGPKARNNTYLILGPWRHGGVPTGDLKAPEPMKIISDTMDAWMGRWSTGKPNEVDNWPPLKCYVANSDLIIEDDCWPPKASKPLRLYFSEDGLTREKTTAEQSFSSFNYDPANPVPTLGGCNLTIANGMRNHASLLEREDVLVFDAPPLEEDVNVVGRVTADLYVKTTGPDTDFTVMLLDVHPDDVEKLGYRGNVCDGIQRLRFRNGTQQESFVERNQIVNIKVDLWSTAFCFKKGHRMAVHVSSSNFPRFDRNLNTDEKCGVGTKARKVTNTLLHDAEHPSSIGLYVYAP
ncbi:MAG TPA: CocE/NonD family hydrolase [Candidatus Brocadiia bacterium]|nr:CocE/NonD family hydrolase [Candidatus Brocadiia bacterium]